MNLSKRDFIQVLGAGAAAGMGLGAYADADADGMPDDWELKNGLDPKNAFDATSDLNGDGYTNIEKFIYGLNPRAPKTDWSDLKNNRDPHISGSTAYRL